MIKQVKWTSNDGTNFQWPETVHMTNASVM